VSACLCIPYKHLNQEGDLDEILYTCCATGAIKSFALSCNAGNGIVVDMQTYEVEPEMMYDDISTKKTK
jgi:hypothetical protein